MDKNSPIYKQLHEAADAAGVATSKCQNTFVVMDAHNRVAWKLLPENRVLFCAIGYDLRPMCLSTDTHAHRLDDMSLFSAHDQRDLAALQADYPWSDIRRLDVYFSDTQKALLDTIDRVIGGAK